MAGSDGQGEGAGGSCSIPEARQLTAGSRSFLDAGGHRDAQKPPRSYFSNCLQFLGCRSERQVSVGTVYSHQHNSPTAAYRKTACHKFLDPVKRLRGI